jgi:carboxylesterase type B
VESGNSDLSWFFQPLDEAETLYAGWAEAVGCPAGSNQLQCLQAKPASAFTSQPENYTGRSALYGSFPSGPVVDGTEHGLPGVPRDMINAAKMAKVPLIIGANKEDASIFEPVVSGPIPGARLEALTQHDVEVVLNWTFSPEDSQKVADMYPASEFSPSINSHQKLLEQALRDLAFHCSNRDVACFEASVRVVAL